MPREADQNALYTTNWSGQILSGGTYTGVAGQWTVPSVVPSASAEYSASWIGIDGVSASSLIQTGTSQETAGGITSYFAWLELLPNAPLNIGSAPVTPGDVMQASIVETSLNVWDISIQDNTANWIYSGSYSYSTPGLSADWIEEAPTVGGSQSTLANFGSTPFSNMQIAGTSGNPVLDPVFMTNPGQTAIIAYPGTYNSSTNSFTDYFGTPPPVVTSVSPSQGSVSGGTNVTISGDFLQSASVVAFGLTNASFVSNSNGTITTTSPSEGAGTVDVAVTTPGGTSAVSGSDRFTFSAPIPPPPSTTPTTASPPPPAPQHGYWLVGGPRGDLYVRFGPVLRIDRILRLQRPVAGIAPTQDQGGYWLVASDGGIFSFGDAGFYGSIPGLGYFPAGTPGNVKRLNAPVVGMVPSTDGGGYFMVASDGGVFAFGDAQV